ncbi:hypothetical protein INR49_030932 [Caranx melampygus]|nr:hypothetical protein INR49_030932 [Caranx melampygus]
MESQRLCRLFFMPTWMFVFLLPYGCSGASAPHAGYTDPGMMVSEELIILAFFTGVLLLFSVVGSVYVFRGLPSLEPRPGSIYDVLDRSPAHRDSDQQKAKAKKNQPPKTARGMELKKMLPHYLAASGGQLAKELKQQDCLQYAAFCNLAMARCEQTLFNAPGEALALTDAARLFLSSEKENRALQAPGFDEHLQAALNCDYDGALSVFTEMQLMCQERGLQLPGTSTPVVTLLPENVFLLLQSVVMACQEKDTESLKSLQTELWPLLTAEQNHLLHLLLETPSPFA